MNNLRNSRCMKSTSTSIKVGRCHRLPHVCTNIMLANFLGTAYMKMMYAHKYDIIFKEGLAVWEGHIAHLMAHVSNCQATPTPPRVRELQEVDSQSAAAAIGSAPAESCYVL